MAAQLNFIPDEIGGAYSILYKHHPAFSAGLTRPPIMIKIDPDTPHYAYLDRQCITMQEKFLKSLTWGQGAFLLGHEIMHYMMRHPELLHGWITAGQVTGTIAGVSYTFPYHEITAQHSLDYNINDGLRYDAGMTEWPDNALFAERGDFRQSEADVYVREYKKKLDAINKQQAQQQAQQGNNPQPGNGPPAPGAPGNGPAKPSPLPGDPSQPSIDPGHGQVGDTKPCDGNTKGQYPTNALVSSDGMGGCVPSDPDGIDQVKQLHIIREFVKELAEKGQGTLAGMVERLSEGLEDTPEDWRKVIRPRVVNAIGRDRETWARFNQSAMMVKSYRPAYEGRRAGTVALFCDTSGSIGGMEQRLFLSAFADMYSQVTPRVTYLGEIDTRVREWTAFKSVPQMRRFIAERLHGDKGLMGGGGTDMRRANDWLVEHDIHPDITIFFTDGYTPFPNSLGNSKRVVWVMTNEYTTAPASAGETIRFTNHL